MRAFKVLNKIRKRHSYLRGFPGWLSLVPFEEIEDIIGIDTFNKLPIEKQNLEIIKKFKSCLVSPSRWGRINEIDKVIKELKDIEYFPDYTMVDYDEIKIWENSIG